MTGRQWPGGPPMGPPWPVEVLADLHAGALDEQLANELWPRVRQDAEARSVLAALDATRTELAGLADFVPAPMPAQFAARLDAALAAQPRPAAPPRPIPQSVPLPPPRPQSARPHQATVIDFAAARQRAPRLRDPGRRRLGIVAGLVVAAAAVVGVVVVLAPGSTTPGTSVAAPPPSSATDGSGAPAGSVPPSVVALSSGQLVSKGFSVAIGKSNYGPLSNPTARAACLAANGVSAGQQIAGANQVTLDGKPGTLFILTTGTEAQFRLLVVGPSCAAGNASQIAKVTIGGVTPTH